jgi:hypothetical protein
MRVIDEKGRYIGVFRRGAFDLPRLLSVDTLGVPFAATTELVKQMGGFSVRDFADDVRFCVGAYGMAHYVHVREPLMDYRLHANSRTEEAGGGGQMQRVFAELMPKIIPTLEQRGLRPVEKLEQAIREGLAELDLFIEDHWHRKLAGISPAWWRGPIGIDAFFLAGLLDVPGFSKKLGRPPRGRLIRDADNRICVMPWTRRKLRRYLKDHRDDLHRLIEKPRNMLITWASIKMGANAGSPVAFRVRALDFRTLWAARQLEIALGWTPLLDASVTGPSWLRWGVASGTEPVLDCAEQVRIVASSTAGA